MIKIELIEAMSDFPNDMPVLIEVSKKQNRDILEVTEICPTPGEGANENYLLIS